VVADEMYGLNQATYTGGDWIDALWLGSYVAWGAAALEPSVARLAPADRRRLPRLSRARVGLLAAALLVAPAISLLEEVRHGRSNAYAVAPFSAAIGMLVLYRLAGLVRAVERARRDERLARREAEQAQRLLSYQNKQLVELDRVKDEFVSSISHELRSPLTVILANLDLLRRDLTPEEHMLSVEEAMEEARRMRWLVNDLLLLAEKDSTRVVARTPMRLDSLIEETVAAIVRQDETHNVRVAVEGPVMVEGDAERLMQVVRNLVENALMHTPAGTMVEVRLAQAHGCAHITVADNGPGIAPEHLPYLWDRFYRVDKARSRMKDSTGLGLPIVKYVAEAQGGSVSVSSTPGQGTTFIVSLPLARQAAQASAAAA
jgi:signal transduction histidine kinase